MAVKTQDKRKMTIKEGGQERRRKSSYRKGMQFYREIGKGR